MASYELTADKILVGSESEPIAPRPASLISPNMDRLMIGGLSLVTFAFAALLIEPQSPSTTLVWTVFYLSFFVNFPHFLASYQLLYWDFGKQIFTNIRFFWAAVLVPLILGGGIILCIRSGEPPILGLFANAMFFFVGWHYVKQIFGGVVVTNALAKYFYTRPERLVLKANLFSLWALSWISQNVGARSFTMEGIPYESLDFPASAQMGAYWAVGLTGIAVLAAHVMKYVREGKVPTLPAIFCFMSIYVWFLPALYHPMYFHLIPFFHSLQYLLFVIAFRRNKVLASLGGSVRTAQHRKGFLAGFYGYLGLVLLAGVGFMWVLPKYLDAHQIIDPVLFGPTVAMFAVTVFINIHHYFIDNVIWRGTNPDMRKYLFGAK